MWIFLRPQSLINSISDIQMPVYTPILLKCQNYEIKRAKYFYEMEKIILIIAQRHLHNGIHYKDLGQNQNYRLTINCKTKKKHKSVNIFHPIHMWATYFLIYHLIMYNCTIEPVFSRFSNTEN